MEEPMRRNRNMSATFLLTRLTADSSERSHQLEKCHHRTNRLRTARNPLEEEEPDTVHLSPPDPTFPLLLRSLLTFRLTFPMVSTQL
jgi:hypothetical protein